MAISTLPDGNSPTLAVVPATKEEMLQMSQKNGASWRGALSMEAYLRREECLAQTRMCVNGGLTGWILIDTARKCRFALAGCETIRKRALMSENGKVREVISHGIGSVFCPVECRKRGYGGRLMKELRTKLENWQTGELDCAFSVLYSDIGKEFYSAYGWQPYPSMHVQIDSCKAPQESCLSTLTVQPLFSSDLGSLCVRDEVLVRKRLECYRDTAVALIPDLMSMEWHHAREEFVANELFGKKPLIKGAMIADEKGRCRAWCIWTRMWYNEDSKSSTGNTMHILRLIVDDGHDMDLTFDNSERIVTSKTATNGTNMTNGLKSQQTLDDAKISAMQALLSVARQEAYRWKCASIDAWNPSTSMIRAAQGLDPNARLQNRELESIPSLRFHGSSDKTIEWVCNEKYAWC